MKTKKLITTILILCSISRSISQDIVISKDKELSYDLITPGTNFPGDFYIKKNARVRYKFTNINRNAYNITVNSEQKSFFTERPTVFNLLTNIDITKLTAIPGLGGAGAALVGTPLQTIISLADANEKVTIGKYQNEKNDVDRLIQTFDRDFKKLKRINLLYKNLVSKSLDACTPFSTILTDKLSLTKNLLIADFAYTGDGSESNLQTTLENVANSLFETLQKNYDDLMKKQAESKQGFALVEQITKLKINEQNEVIKKAIAEEAEKIKNANGPNKAQTIKNATDDRERKVKAANALINAIGDEILYEKLISDAQNEVIVDVKVASAKTTELQQGGLTTSLIQTYKKINSSNFEYISPSFKATKDEMIIKISIEPKEGLACNLNYNQFNGEYSGKIYGFKMNFSTGLFLLGGKNIFDQTYRVDTIAGNPNNNIIKKNDNKTKIQPAVGALMHFYWKKPSWFSWGGSFGISVSSQTNINYHGGLSFLLGEEQRVIISFGATLANAKQIADVYKEDQIIPKTLTLNPVPTSNYYRWGSFFALTYNLSN